MSDLEKPQKRAALRRKGRRSESDGLDPWPRAAITRVALGLGVLLAAAGFVLLVTLDDDFDPGTGVASSPDPTDSSDTTEAATTTEPSDGGESPNPADSADPSGTPASGTRSAAVELALDDFQFSVTGVVPDEASAEAITEAATATYGDRASVDLDVDPDVQNQPWLTEVPFLVRNLTRIIDGDLSIDDRDVTISGRVADRGSIEFLADAVSTENGFPPLSAEGVELVSLRPSMVRATSSDGVLTIDGTVPSASVRDAIVDGAIESYGDGNVVDELEISADTFARFDLIRFGEDIGVFEPAGDFDIGVADGSFYAVLSEGISFDVGDSRLTPRAQFFLDGFPPIVERTPGNVTIVGHTDDIGSEVDNLALSEARAQAVAVHLANNGVDPTRLVVIGMGESEPVGLNSTDEGRAENRRVVITMGVDG